MPDRLFKSILNSDNKNLNTKPRTSSPTNYMTQEKKEIKISHVKIPSTSSMAVREPRLNSSDKKVQLRNVSKQSSEDSTP